MATWRKTNEAWFGDTFDRNTMLCNAEIAYDTALNSDYTVAKGINWNDSSEAVISKGVLDSFCNYGNAYAISETDTVSDRFYELQAQIDELRKKLETKKEDSELRSALKTLHYKREVE